MKVYVANCTQQTHDFAYRLPEMPVGRPAIRQQIAAGGQVRLSGDLNTPDIESVVHQHTRYGLVAMAEVANAQEVVSLIYSIDKPVPEATIRYAIGRNRMLIQGLGRTLRVEAGIAVNNQLNEANPGAGLHSVELEVEEEKTRSNPDPTFKETVKVDRDAPPDAPPQTTEDAPRRRRGRPRKVA